MYTACTQNLIRVFGLPFLDPIPSAFVWVALAAWALTFAGLVLHVIGLIRESTGQQSQTLREGPAGKPRAGQGAEQR
jgi:hypothetical protein